MPTKISRVVAEIIDQEDTLYISDVSCLEISLKWSSNKLKLPSSPRVWFKKQIDEWKLITLKLEREHIYRSSELGYTAHDLNFLNGNLNREQYILVPVKFAAILQALSQTKEIRPRP